MHAGGQVPAATVDLFVRLLEALDRGQSEDALRPHLYAALLSFMQYSQGRRPAQASPQIFAALLKSGTIPPTLNPLLLATKKQPFAKIQTQTSPLPPCVPQTSMFTQSTLTLGSSRACCMVSMCRLTSSRCELQASYIYKFVVSMNTPARL